MGEQGRLLAAVRAGLVYVRADGDGGVGDTLVSGTLTRRPARHKQHQGALRAVGSVLSDG